MKIHFVGKSLWFMQNNNGVKLFHSHSSFLNLPIICGIDSVEVSLNLLAKSNLHLTLKAQPQVCQL